ncbi:uncharacterized protein NPIL_607421 [Nephila pilipes]|uniref:Mutator-like transposase domain-containing protein n=1 Tax=Nephila pilipes TaxID=299642 RepID=A0A8X6UEV7_NEPPI|nr:uncharacterized protein NPIL_607421 [Nephila pilipes]
MSIFPETTALMERLAEIPQIYRLVYAMRCIGKGAESAVMFCGIMNLPPPPTKFTKFNNILLQAARETCEESMAEVVHEAVEENEGGRDIAVAVDGSWQK